MDRARVFTATGRIKKRSQRMGSTTASSPKRRGRRGGRRPSRSTRAGPARSSGTPPAAAARHRRTSPPEPRREPKTPSRKLRSTAGRAPEETSPLASLSAAGPSMSAAAVECDNPGLNLSLGPYEGAASGSPRFPA
jgi:hypothetical protein